MSPIDQPVISKGSIVLVTGVNGFIASHIADKFLKFGYKVRGTTRNAQKNAWICNLFDKKYGPDKFELVVVPDMELQGAYDEVIKGVSAVVHTATNYTMNPNPHEVVPGSVAGTVNALAAAAKEPSVRRFVLTSSSAAALIPKPNNFMTVTTETWNDEVVKFAYRGPPYEPERAYPVYAASKMLSEKEAWKFVEEKKPHFVLNAVLPNINFGASLDIADQGHPSTSGMVAELFKGNTSLLAGLPAQYFVDVQDDALLHVAAAIHPGVESERIFAFAEPVNGDSILSILRKLYPQRTFPDDFQAEKDLSEIIPRKRAEQLLLDMGKDGWTSLKESIHNNTEDLVWDSIIRTG
ncbi:aldehyde reductase [Truncatella angustata]|uniref:Aldehyde reductase n=1 Tax=Truncatella angustata TaxID=152316 RepID=A0A9P8UGG3_9PEZI|nr:aldehyde reductase [Truncatella angustata]KAH6651597.1 aldehyde reductase [Truncatella angustata]